LETDQLRGTVFCNRRNIESLRALLERLLNMDPREGYKYLKNESDFCRSLFIKGEDYTGPLSLFDNRVSLYIGRSLPWKDPDLVKESTREAIESFLQDVHCEPIPEIRETISQWIHGIKEHSHYSESGCIFNDRRKGGQASFISDFLNVVKIKKTVKYRNSRIIPRWADVQYNDFAIMKRICMVLDHKYFIHTAGCKGECASPHLHFPFVVTSFPESGYRARTVGVPPPTLVFMTSPIQESVYKGMQEDPLLSESLKGEIDFKGFSEFEVTDSVDFKSATNNFPLELQREFIHGFANKIEDPIMRMYIICSFSRTRLVTKQRVKWPGLDYFLQKYTGLQLSYETVRERLQAYSDEVQRIFGNMCYGDQSYLDKYPYPIFGYKTMDIDLKGICRRKIISANAEDILDRMISYYHFMFEFEEGILTTCGQHMSLPLSFPALCATNVSVIRHVGKTHFINAKVMGDDAILSSSMDGINLYRETIQKLGLIIHPTKDIISYIGRGVFCEKIFDINGELKLTRIKKYLQPNLFGISRVLHLSDEIDPGCLHILDFRIMQVAKDFWYLVSKGYDFSIPKILGGQGIGTMSERTNQMIRTLDHKELLLFSIKMRELLSETIKVSKVPLFAIVGTGLEFGSVGLKLDELYDLLLKFFMKNALFDEINAARVKEVTLDMLACKQNKLFQEIPKSGIVKIVGDFEKIKVTSNFIRSMIADLSGYP
jgi:hypothetical protein